MRAHEFLRELDINMGKIRGPGKGPQSIGNDPAQKLDQQKQQANQQNPQIGQPIGQNNSANNTIPGSATQGTIGTQGTVGTPGTPDPKSGLVQQSQPLAGQIQDKRQQDQQRVTDRLTKDSNNKDMSSIRNDLQKIKGQLPQDFNLQKTMQALKNQQDGKKLTPNDNMELAKMGSEISNAVLDDPAMTNKFGSMLGQGLKNNEKKQQQLKTRTQQELDRQGLNDPNK
jgi:hypothetical protein